MSMKKYFAIAMMALVALSCTKESVSKKNDSSDSQVDGLRITVSTAGPVSRVSAGTEADGKLPILWNAGDQIAVIQDKGSASQKVSIFQLVGAGGTVSAEFEYVSGDASLNLIKDIVYPATAIDGSIPQAQSYVEGSFDPAAALMTFHSDAGVAPTAGFTLSHAASYICLQLSGKSGQSVTSIAAKAGGASYTLTCSSPVALGETAVPFYIVVPAASCDAEFLVTLFGGGSVKKVSIGKEFQTGSLHRFPESKVIDRGDLFEGGIVFYTDYSANYLYTMSLDETTVAFSTENVSIGTAANPSEGLENFALIIAMPNYPDAYPAAKWCADKGPGWYLPGRAELVKIWNNLFSAVAVSGVTSIGSERAQALLEYFGGTQMALNTYYQSCCENAADKVHQVKMDAKKTVYQQKKSAERAVRAVKKVTI